VGGEDVRRTEARVIAATHQRIEQLIEQGDFREDLYFRLKVVEIDVPPLRARVDDIPLLANALLGRIREETHRDVRRISDDAVLKLCAHDWPGNVRELENALMRAAIMARGTVIGPDHLILGDEEEVLNQNVDLSLEAAIQRHVKLVLESCDGDEAQAADVLEIAVEELKALQDRGD
jgi:two-component system response regulator HydG